MYRCSIAAGRGEIAISVFIVIIAPLNLVLDFEFVERGVYAHAAKCVEWYAAFGIRVISQLRSKPKRAS